MGNFLNMADFKTYQIDSTKYPRVTQIIKCTKDKHTEAKMLRWMHKLYSQLPSDDQKADNSMKRGIKLHEEIEHFLKHNTIPTRPFSSDFKTILPYLVNIYKPIIIAVEKQVYSKKLKYAGTMDALAIDNGLMVIDWLTSYRFKKKEWVHHKFLQATAYAIAFEEMTGQKVNKLRVVSISRKVQEFTDYPANFRDEWLKRLDIFHRIYSKLNDNNLT